MQLSCMFLCSSLSTNHLWPSGCEPTAVTYTSLMEAFARSSQPEIAEYILNEMKTGGTKPDSVTYAVLINGYCQSGEIGNAERVFRYKCLLFFL